jgi:hypothetical protein
VNVRTELRTNGQRSSGADRQADVFYWIGMALGAAVMVMILRGFWRGLSLRPTDLGSRPPEELWS